MKRKLVYSFCTILALLAALFAAPSRVLADSSTLLPVSYTTTSGADGGQPVTNLHVQDQSGSQNDWDKYVEFNTPTAYAGYRSYTVPAAITPASLTAIQVKANFLGPAPATQTWTWSIYNWNTSAWVTLGTNIGASWSAWKFFTFDVSGTFSDFVNGSTREIRIRIQSNDAADDADLDYEAVLLTYTSGGATPTSTATSTHTATPSFTPTNTPVGPTNTFTNTPTSTTTFTPTPTAVGGSNFNSPSSNSADAGGDGNGFQTNPQNAYSDNAAFAVDTNSGSGTATSCTSSAKDKHRYYDYNFNVPSGAIIDGIEVRLDAFADSTSGTPRSCVQLSWNGGSTWTAAQTTATLSTSEASYLLGGPTNTWGRTWSDAEFSNANFRLRVINIASNTARDFSLDWAAVKVYYTPAAPTSTFTPTFTPGGPTSTFTPTATVTNTPAPSACTHFVSTTGNDSNSGTSIGLPWRTIQKAANTVGVGSTVCVRGGTYAERVTFSVSGAPGQYTTFQSYTGETAIVDGTGLSVPAGNTGLFMVTNQSYLIIKGFEIRNYKTSTTNNVPVGLRIVGTAHHIEIRDNKIHHIEHNGTAMNGTDAHGLSVHGTSGTQSVNNIIIDGNELYNLKLGSSEALVLNGNVEFWQVTNNIVRDSNNIGIDIIGFESTAPSNDQARDGLVAYNDVYNITSAGNVAYGTDRSAGCIYVDGGTRITIEYNKAHNCNLGVEIASEHQGTATSYVTVRNNFIYNNTDVGIGMGGYDNQRGSTENCVIVNNTFYNNAAASDAWGSELYIQYDTRNNIIRNNIFHAKSGMPYILSWSPVMTNNVMNNNLFYGGTTWQWKNVNYTTYAAYQSGTGNDANSLNNVNPLFVNAATGDLHLQTGSPAINAGQTIPEAGSLDIDGQARAQGASIDMGADEKQ